MVLFISSHMYFSTKNFISLEKSVFTRVHHVFHVNQSRNVAKESLSGMIQGLQKVYSKSPSTYGTQARKYYPRCIFFLINLCLCNVMMPLTSKVDDLIMSFVVFQVSNNSIMLRLRVKIPWPNSLNRKFWGDILLTCIQLNFLNLSRQLWVSSNL